MIQTCGCACAVGAPRAVPPTSSSKPSNRRIYLFMSGSLGFQQAAATQQRVRLRLAATEGDIGVFWIARAARRIDVVVQPLCYSGIEDVAGLLEGAERVGVHHLGPHVAVIARRI